MKYWKIIAGSTAAEKKSSNINYLLAAGLCTLFGQTIPAISIAQETNALIEEVVVTARKREERLQDIPSSAAALSESFTESYAH